MKHATAEALDALEPLLKELRGLDGIVERRRGNFSRRSRAFLHFHEDPAGLFADVREQADFVRHRVSTARERQAFARHVRRLLDP